MRVDGVLRRLGCYVLARAGGALLLRLLVAMLSGALYPVRREPRYAQQKPAETNLLLGNGTVLAYCRQPASFEHGLQASVLLR